MKGKVLLYTTIIILLICISSRNVFSWDNDVTHRDISAIAADNSVLSNAKGDYLRNLGFSSGLDEKLTWNKQQTVKEWISEGAYHEDDGSKWQLATGQARSYNHFHNPLKQYPWTDAGLDDWIALPPFHTVGESSIIWAQDSDTQKNSVGGDWSWQNVRLLYYYALTAQTDTDRQKYFANTFDGLGHQMHLIQDASQPDHVRNDAHPLDGGGYVMGLETWAKKNPGIINGFAANPVMPNVSFNVTYGGYPNFVPIAQLIDTDQYDGTNPSTSVAQGLAEYTNANFFSLGTIFPSERFSTNDRHYFPFPKEASTDMADYLSGSKPTETFTDKDGITKTGVWISKVRDGEGIHFFLRPGYYSRALYKISGDSELFLSTFFLDEACHHDYAALLIPRAVGYSAGLLNYFFRGTIEITPPAQYVYSITDGSKTYPFTAKDGNGNSFDLQEQQFTKIKAKLRNTTPNEAMQSGTIIAIAKYKKRTSYQPDLTADPPDMDKIEPNFTYSVSAPIPLTDENLASMNASPTEFAFDFSSNPIPAGITDLYLQVVFKGTLGNEKDSAIAVGWKDLMEPTHHVYWNLTDRFSILGPNDTEYHTLTSDKIRADSDLLNIVNQPPPAYIDPFDITYEISYMGSSSASASAVPVASVTLSAGNYVRLVLLVEKRSDTTDLWASRVHYLKLKATDTIDGTTNSVIAFLGAYNQDTITDNGEIFYYTDVEIFRTITDHFDTGVLRCRPQAYDSVTGEKVCPYNEADVTTPPDLAPTPVDLSMW